MVFKKNSFNKGTGYQLLAAVAGTINVVSDGMQYGWTAPIVPILKSPESPVKIDDTDVVWLEMVYMLGGLVGLPITAYLVDRIGRKKSALAASFSSLVGWVLIGMANRIEFLLVGRFITGIASDMAFNASPMYIAEIAHQSIRGFLSSIIYLMMLVGIVVIYSIGPFFPIYVSAAVGIVLLTIQLITFSFMPESPYYLIFVGKTETARESLIKFRGSDDVDDELKEIIAAVERQKSEKGRFKDLFTVKNNRRALTIMTVLNATQHFVGITVILMNLHEILEAAGSIYMTPINAAIVFSTLMLISASCSTLIVDRYGRKILLLVSSVCTGLSVFSLAVYFTLKDLEYDVANISWIPIVSVMIFAVVFKLGLGLIPIVMTAELFSAKVKGKGMASSDFVYDVCSTLSIYVYQVLATNVTIAVPFYIFAACSFLCTFFIAYKIPETKGKTLEEIQMILKM